MKTQTIRISGPEEVYIFDNGQKYIILFGEDHGNEFFASDGLVTMVDFLEQCNNVDVFLEAAWVSQGDKAKYKADNIETYDNTLTVLKNTYHKELYTHNRLNTNNKRFHFTDIRIEPNLSRLWLFSYSLQQPKEEDTIFILNIIYDFSTATKLIDYMDACVTSDNFPKSIQSIFGKEDSDYYIVRKSLTSLPSQKTKVKLLHRIKKQIELLHDDKKRLLLQYHKDNLDTMKMEPFFTKYDENRNIILKDENIRSKHVVGVKHLFGYMLRHLMDMYHLARMLCYMDKQTHLISYTGSYHTNSYKIFFKKYMKLDMIHKSVCSTPRIRFPISVMNDLKTS